MKQPSEELLAVVYRYYPRGIARDDPRYYASEEYARLSAARREAGGASREPWRALLRRLEERFPGRVGDHSLHLPSGQFDACYTGSIEFPADSGVRAHAVYFLVGFLAPVYVIYGERHVEEPHSESASRSPPATVNVYQGDTAYILPRSVVTEEARAKSDALHAAAMKHTRTRPIYSLVLTPDEQSVAAVLSSDIEARFGCEPMPRVVGLTAAPDVATTYRGLGEATLYDCLLSDNGGWSTKLTS
jgi:hypothetical protein